MDGMLSIIIGSCDAYRDVATLYVRFLRKYWPNCSYPVYVVTEKKAIDEPEVICVTDGTGNEWVRRIIKTVEMTNTKYIWLTVDDLFIYKRVNNNRISNILSIMEKENIQYYGFPSRSIEDPHYKRHCKRRMPYKGYKHIFSISRDIPYGVNMGTAIWEKRALLDILGDGIETAWDIENYFLEKASKKLGGYYEHYVDDDGTSLKYAHMIKKGKWIQKGVKDIANSGISIDFNKRGYVPFSSRLRTLVVGTGNYVFPTKSRAVVKKILSKVGFKFATKY